MTSIQPAPPRARVQGKSSSGAFTAARRTVESKGGKPGLESTSTGVYAGGSSSSNVSIVSSIGKASDVGGAPGVDAVSSVASDRSGSDLETQERRGPSAGSQHVRYQLHSLIAVYSM